MADLSPARVQALKDRIAKATRGPWQVIETRYGIHEPRCAMCDTVAERRIATVWDHPQLKGPLGVVNLFVTSHPVVDWDEKVYRGVSLDEADADLIAHAREDLPDLLAALEAQGQTIARLEKEKAEAESTFTSFAEHHAATESALAAKDAELARLTAERTWRPIETAPIDRRVIVNASDGPCEAYLNGTPMRWVTSHGTPIRPTRWMPFPSDPPVAADAPKETT